MGRAASRARARACLALRPPAAAGLRAGARLRARRAAAGRQGPLPGGSRSSAPLAVVLRPARLEQQGTSAAAAGMRAPPRHARPPRGPPRAGKAKGGLKSLARAGKGWGSDRSAQGRRACTCTSSAASSLAVAVNSLSSLAYVLICLVTAPVICCALRPCVGTASIRTDHTTCARARRCRLSRAHPTRAPAGSTAPVRRSRQAGARGAPRGTQKGGSNFVSSPL